MSTMSKEWWVEKLNKTQAKLDRFVKEFEELKNGDKDNYGDAELSLFSKIDFTLGWHREVLKQFCARRENYTGNYCSNINTPADPREWCPAYQAKLTGNLK